MKKVGIFTPAALMLLSAFALFTIHQRAAADTQIEEKIYSGATLEHEFTDDKVLVVLNKRASMNFSEYTPEDFPEGLFSRVDDSTGLTMELVRKQLEAEATGDWSEIQHYADNKMLVNVEGFRRILTLTLAEKSKGNVLNAIKLLEKREDVFSADPNYFLSASYTPSATHYNDQKPAFDMIDMEGAWDVSTGSSSVKVGVLDSGIRSDNANLNNRIDTNLSRTFTDAPNGAPGGLDDACEDYALGHGTLVAGVIGANDTGVVGVNINVTLVSLQILKDYINAPCKCTWSHVTNAIDYAAGANIPILNASFGADAVSISTYSNALKAAINNYPGLFVAAAGNKGDNIDNTPSYPAVYNLPNMIVVGALNDNYSAPAPAAFSNYSPTKVHLFAPGSNIRLTFGATSYTKTGGTSYAAPLVSGVAALIKAHYNMGAAQIKTIILNNVTPKTSLNGKSTTGGILNAKKALTLTQTCGSELDNCNASHDPATYLAMCQNECWEQAPPYCYPPIDYVGCVDYWLGPCFMNCEEKAQTHCGDQFLSCIGW